MIIIGLPVLLSSAGPSATAALQPSHMHPTIATKGDGQFDVRPLRLRRHRRLEDQETFDRYVREVHADGRAMAAAEIAAAAEE